MPARRPPQMAVAPPFPPSRTLPSQLMWVDARAPHARGCMMHQMGWPDGLVQGRGHQGRPMVPRHMLPAPSGHPTPPSPYTPHFHLSFPPRVPKAPPLIPTKTQPPRNLPPSAGPPTSIPNSRLPTDRRRPADVPGRHPGPAPVVHAPVPVHLGGGRLPAGVAQRERRGSGLRVRGSGYDLLS